MALCSKLRERCGTSINDEDHEELSQNVRDTSRRWTVFLIMHSILEISACVLYTVSGLLDSRTRYWPGLGVQSGRVLSTLCFVLSQAYPIVTYNEKVWEAKFALEEFLSAQLLNRMPVEFTVGGVVVNRNTFKVILCAGATSAMSGLIKYLMILLMGSENMV